MNAHAISSVTDFIVLSGFLGSGKTTLLADFLALPEAADTAVIINEVGQIDIDGAVIAETGYALPVALLSNGCVCCTVGNDLLYTIEALVEGRRLAKQKPLRRIVLECSGLSRPAAVLRSLGDLARFEMRVQIVATRDSHASPLSSGFEDAAAQLAAAQSIVLTKTEQIGATARAGIKGELRRLNPFAELVDVDDRRKRALAAFVPQTQRTLGGGVSDTWMSNPGAFEHPRIEVMLASFPEPPTWGELEEWLENMVGLCGDRLLRLKGIVRVADALEPLLIQAVGNMFSTPRRMPRHTSGATSLVIIARDLTIGEAREAQLGVRAVFSRNNAPTNARASAAGQSIASLTAP